MKRLTDDQAKELSCVRKSESFEVEVDAHGYLPEELSVSIVGNVLMIDGKHEETFPGGTKFTSREFRRAVPLPNGAIFEATTSCYSLDGKTLKVTVPVVNGSQQLSSSMTSSSSSSCFSQQQQQFQSHQQQSTNSKLISMANDNSSSSMVGIQVNRETSPTSKKMRC